MDKNRQARLRLVRNGTASALPESWSSSDVPASSPSLTAINPMPEPVAHPPRMLSESPQSFEQHLTRLVLSSDSCQTALVALSQVIRDAFQADYCVITIHLRHQGTWPEAYWYPHPPTATHSRQGSTLISSLLNHPAIAPQWYDDALAIDNFAANVPLDLAAAEPGAAKPKMGDLPFQALLATRTQLHGQINGTISVIRSQPYAWKEADVQLLKTLSPQVAIAISQVQLEQQIQKQIQYQSLIDQLTAAIRDGWLLEQIFQLATAATIDTLQVSRGLLLLFKYSNPLQKSRATEAIPETRATVVAAYPQLCDMRATQLPTAPQWERAIAPLERPNSTEPDQDMGTWINHTFWASDCGICQPILAGLTDAVVIPAGKTHGEAKGNPATAAALFDFDSHPSVVVMPLENQGTILGCLVLQDDQHRLWSPEELSFVKLVAAQLSTAIIQTRTLQQVQAVVNERTAQLRRSLEVQAKLYEKTRQQVEQLRRLNHEREEFLSTVSHELLTPLTSMRLAIRMLRQAELTPERCARYLDILEQQCTQETKLINDMLALRKLETHPTSAQLHKLDIKYLIRDIVESVEASWAEKGLNLVIDLPTKPLTIYTDPDSLNRVLAELLSNAKKYSAPNSTIALKVVHDVNPPTNQLILSLRNVGFGIQPDEQPLIFNKFRRGQGATKQAIQGTGLGLALVKGLVEHMSGAIAVSSHPLDDQSAWETCFTITLPQHPEGVVRALPS